MKRIRTENINTKEHFNQIFETHEDVYSSYPQIQQYDIFFKLGLFVESSILDYGCGNANSFAKIVTKNKITGIGVDISTSVTEKNKKDFPSLQFYTVEEFENSSMRADVVICTHTLEHTENPFKIAEKLLAVANKKLLIIVPYKESWNKCPEHLWEFDKNSFKKLLPTYVQVGITNQAGYTEIIYFWDKNREKFSKFKNILNTLRLIPLHSKMGIIKKTVNI